MKTKWTALLCILLFASCSHNKITPDPEEIEEPSPVPGDTIRDPDVVEDVVYYGNEYFPDSVIFNCEGGNVILKTKHPLEQWNYESLYLHGVYVRTTTLDDLLSKHPDLNFLNDITVTMGDQPWDVLDIEYKKWFKLTKIDEQTMRVIVLPSDTARSLRVDLFANFSFYPKINIIQE